MTSVEIENVLSSIRKLVSEDLRPQARAHDLAATPDTIAPVLAVAGEPEKLLLTPALRVVASPADLADDALFKSEVPAPTAQDHAAPSAQPDLPAEARPATRLRLEAVVSTIGASMNPPADGWEAETGDAFVTRVNWTAPRAEGADHGQTGAALHFTHQAHRAGMAADAADDTDAGVAGADADDDLSFSGADEVPPPEAAPAEAAPPKPTMATAEDPMIDLDEDALHDLVRDMIREELQGPMGERITRNIRKLVRAEVARALAAQTLG